MTYLVPPDPDSYKSRAQLDMQRFAADLAKELGGTVLPEKDEPSSYRSIRIGADQLNLRWNDWKGRLVATIAAPDVPHEDRDFYTDSHKTQDATVNPDRDIKRVAADIKRRVIDASKEALSVQRKRAAEFAQARADIKKQAAALKAATGLDVTVNESERNATIYGNTSNENGFYLQGRLYGDGSVTIDRLGSMSMAKFKQIVAILQK